MYIPLNPNKIDGVGEKFKNHVLRNKLSHLIEDGKYSSIGDEKLNTDQVSKLVQRLMKIAYVRLGSNRMNSIPPHLLLF